MKSKLITQALLNYRNNGGTLPLVEAYKIINNMNFAEGGDLPESGLPEKNPTIVDADNNRQGSLLTGMMKARMAIAAQMGNTSAQRMTSVSPKTYQFTGNEQINGENIGVPKGEVGTHFMASMDEYAVPFIQERNNKLQFISNPRYNDAESMRFESPEDAEYFAEHYKDIAPMMQSFATGGELPEEPPVTNLSNYIRDTSSSNDNTNYKSVPLKKGEPPIIGGTLPTVEIKASNTPRNYRNDPISRREDIKTVPITKNNIHNYPVSVQTEFMKQQVADRPDYEAIKNFENFAATGFGLAPIGIVDDVISSAIGTGTKYLGKYTSKHIPQFKSEIDWGKWNPDTPNYPELINEYNIIEESTKKAGTWMKNPDGSAFQGTPEQFIQQQSSWFKKAFPNYYNKILNHNSPNKFNEFSDKFFSKTSDEGWYGKGVYTHPDKSYTKDYGDINYELYVNSNNKGFINENNIQGAKYYKKSYKEELKNINNQVSSYIKEIKDKYDYEIEDLNVGGGFGVRYTTEDEPMPLEYFTDAIMEEVIALADIYEITRPNIFIEPGRYIVAEAGITLYTVGSVKNIESVRKYICIDGGMADNPRPSLYQAKYSACIANKMYDEDTELVTVAGKCCESGDILIWDINLPKVERGDILAVMGTGAYNYSMSSNYNKLAKPAVVMIHDKEDRLIVQRESYEDLLKNDLG